MRVSYWCSDVCSSDLDDRYDPQSLGFVCSKGTSAPEEHNGGKRLLHPLKRMPDGNFERISLEQALEEIAAKLREIIDRDGPEAVSAFKGSGGRLEEHTSELQSLMRISYAVFCLKKKK